jgi:predicted CXXCH cytochrome family protein
MFLLDGGSLEEVCAKCHEWGKHSAHPLGAKAVDQRNRNLTLDCLSCHRTHGTPFKHLAHFDTKKDLCVQCHSEMGM